MKNLLVATLVAIAVGTATDSLTPAEALKRPEVVRTHRNGHHFDHTTLELPNLNDAKGTFTMSCTTCTEVVTDIWERLHPQIQLQRSSSTAAIRQVRKSAYIDVVDNACLNLDNKYGLVLDASGRATHSMSGDEDTERLRGQWVNKYVTKECARIVKKAHERIIHHINEFKNETDFAQRVCVDWTNSCPLIKQKPTHAALKGRVTDL